MDQLYLNMCRLACVRLRALFKKYSIVALANDPCKTVVLQTRSSKVMQLKAHINTEEMKDTTRHRRWANLVTQGGMHSVAEVHQLQN